MEVVKAVCCGRFGFGSCKDTSVGACFCSRPAMLVHELSACSVFQGLAIECSVKGLHVLFECCAREL